jgi:hypothetical protein
MLPPPYLARLLVRKALHPTSERRLKPEQRLSVAVANMIRAELLTGKLVCRCTHIKNEHEASGRTAALQVEIAKAMGTIPGAPDWTFGSGGFCGDIELKVESNGRLSDRQKDFREWCADVSVPYVVCKSVDDVRDMLIGWKLLSPSPLDEGRLRRRLAAVTAPTSTAANPRTSAAGTP